MTVGRLDINTEGLLLMTNDGGLARVLELPTTGWLRRYRVRVHGKVDEEALARLQDGIALRASCMVRSKQNLSMSRAPIRGSVYRYGKERTVRSRR